MKNNSLPFGGAQTLSVMETVTTIMVFYDCGVMNKTHPCAID